MENLLYIAIIILGGLITARILGKLNFPQVTGYLIAGLLIGPSLLGLIPGDAVKSLEVISEIALAFIAFSIGSEMRLENLKKLGSKIILITLFEALGAFVVVTLGLILFFKTSVAFAITLGSIACATAPAATLMVIKEYRAQGELVDVLIPVVALDDAVCIITFGIASSIAATLMAGGDFHVGMMIWTPIKEILLAIIVGSVGGLISNFLFKKARNDDEMMSLLIVLIFALTAIALRLEVSSLLTLMVSGFVIANLGNSSRRIHPLMDKITPPIFICFFVLSGADLNVKSLATVGLIGVFYILGRALGKFGGSFISTRMAGFSENVQKYLGLTLIPQAGVAIGLSLIAHRIIPDPYGGMIRTIILGATLFYELVGPLVAKFALSKAGCIKTEKTAKSS